MHLARSASLPAGLGRRLDDEQDCRRIKALDRLLAADHAGANRPLGTAVWLQKCPKKDDLKACLGEGNDTVSWPPSHMATWSEHVTQLDRHR
jgi:hypothetical protein